MQEARGLSSIPPRARKVGRHAFLLSRSNRADRPVEVSCVQQGKYKYQYKYKYKDKDKEKVQKIQNMYYRVLEFARISNMTFSAQ